MTTLTGNNRMLKMAESLLSTTLSGMYTLYDTLL